MIMWHQFGADTNTSSVLPLNKSSKYLLRNDCIEFLLNHILPATDFSMRVYTNTTIARDKSRSRSTGFVCRSFSRKCVEMCISVSG